MVNREVKDKKRDPGQTSINKATRTEVGNTVNPTNRSDTVEEKTNKLKI